MKTTKPERVRKPKIESYYAKLNGQSCRVVTLFFRRNVQLLLPSGFGIPEHYKNRDRLNRIIERTRRVSQDIRTSIIGSWVCEKEPLLAPLAQPCDFEIVPYRPPVAKIPVQS
jgi:hypothetical protein